MCNDAFLSSLIIMPILLCLSLSVHTKGFIVQICHNLLIIYLWIRIQFDAFFIMYVYMYIFIDLSTQISSIFGSIHKCVYRIECEEADLKEGQWLWLFWMFVEAAKLLSKMSLPIKISHQGGHSLPFSPTLDVVNPFDVCQHNGWKVASCPHL